MEKVRKFLKEAWQFMLFTIKDFQWVWDNAPNVLIWCGIGATILFFI